MIIFRNILLRKQIITIAGPAIVEMVMYMLIGVVDIAIVGRLGPEALAAVSLGAEIFFAIILLLEALAIGSTILVAQGKGANRQASIDQIIAHTMIMALTLGLAAAFLGLGYSSQLLNLFSVEASVYQQAYSYLMITFKIAPLALILYMVHALFRGYGRTDIPMIIAVITNIFNVVGDYVLVYGKWGFPSLGVSGAAWATAGAHILGFVIAMWFLLSGKGGISLKLSSLFHLKPKVFTSIVRLGFPTMMEQLFQTVSHLISIYLLVYMGTLVFACHQVAITVESISYMPGFGLAIAATTLVGQAVGARDKKALSEAARGCLEFAILLMGFFGVIFALIPYQVAAIFSNDAEVINLSAWLIRLASLEQITVAISMVIGGALKGSGDTRTPFLISLFFTWIFRLPLIYLIIRVLHWGITLVWLVFILDWFFKTVIYLIIYRRRGWIERALPEQ